jgi:hypothetical protein
MDKMEIIEVAQIDGSVIEHVYITHDDGSFTSMTKAHYEELEAAKEVKADEAKTK